VVRRVWISLALAAATALCGTAIAAAQSTSAEELGVGKLLVSSKGLPDPTFAKSVVLLIQYDQHGAVGLMVNHRSQVPISRVLEDVESAKHASDPAYIGGPVEMEAVLALLRSQKKPEGSTSVLKDVYLVSSKPPLEEALAASSAGRDLRIYLGYCGWDGGQLENEVRRGGWWIFEANATVVFDPNPSTIWSRLILRTEQQIAKANLARLSLRSGDSRPSKLAR
jgi:putative AlgH/UPF0301 family transcriptional regulator